MFAIIGQGAYEDDPRNSVAFCGYGHDPEVLQAKAEQIAKDWVAKNEDSYNEELVVRRERERDEISFVVYEAMDERRGAMRYVSAWTVTKLLD